MRRTAWSYRARPGLRESLIQKPEHRRSSASGAALQPAAFLSLLDYLLHLLLHRRAKQRAALARQPLFLHFAFYDYFVAPACCGTRGATSQWHGSIPQFLAK